MKRSKLFVLIAVFCSAAYSQNAIYVSPDGNDMAGGSIYDPLKTPMKAIEQVRAIKKTHSGDITVYLRGGTYFIDKTLVFGLEDGGKEGQWITWAAYPGEEPVLSSGLKLSGWKKSGKLPGLPPEARGKVFETCFPTGPEVPKVMFEGDRMLRRSRSKGFKSRIDGLGRDGQSHLRSYRTMYVNEKAELKNWNNPEDMELVIRPWGLWMMNNLPVRSIDLKERSITTRTDGSYFLTDERYNRFPEEHAWLENLLEGMTEPGSWTINSKTGKVYYWPLDETPGEEVMIPLLQEFIRVEGFSDTTGLEDIPVRNMVFRGISFKHNNRYVFKEQDAATQHDWELFDKDNAFFRFRGAENCVLEECEFTAGGGVGIRLDLYCQNIMVRNNYIHGIGGTGIFLGGYGLGIKDVNRKNTITNNIIHDAGRLFWHCSAITISQSGENLISHNQISSMPYSGITMTGYRIWRMHGLHKDNTDEVYSLREQGWYGMPASSRVDLWMRKSSRGVRWNEIGEPLSGTGENITAARDSLYYWHALMSYFNMNHNRMNIVENNEISDVLKVLADGNGIYIADTGPYNVLRNNFIHSSPHAVGAGIRTDAQQINAYIFGNIVWKFTGGIASSADCMVLNNIVASCPDPGPGETARMAPFYYDYLSNTGNVFRNGLVMRNVIWHEGSNRPGFRLDTDKMEQGHNVVNCNFYYWKDHMPEMEALLSTLRELNMEEKGQVLDPGFLDPENGLFELSSSSPLLKNGFVPINQKAIGLKRKDFPERFLLRQ